MTETYQQGFEAARAGKSLYDNPYVFHSKYYNEWRSGFLSYTH